MNQQIQNTGPTRGISMGGGGGCMRVGAGWEMYTKTTNQPTNHRNRENELEIISIVYLSRQQQESHANWFCFPIA